MRFAVIVLLSMLLWGCEDSPRGVPEPPVEPQPPSSTTLKIPVVEPAPEQCPPGQVLLRGRKCIPGPTLPSDRIVPTQEDLPTMSVVKEGEGRYRVTLLDVPHPRPDVQAETARRSSGRALSGWGKGQVIISTRGQGGMVIDELDRDPSLTLQETSRVAGQNYYSLITFPTKPVKVSMLVKSEVPIHISYYPTNGECVYGFNTKGGIVSGGEFPRTWRWKDPDERHFCSKPDEV